MKYYNILILVFSLFRVDALFGQDIVSSSQTNELNEMILKSISEVYNEYHPITHKMLATGYIQSGGMIIKTDTLWLNVYNMPYQIEADGIPGVNLYSEWSIYGVSSRQTYNSDRFLHKREPTLCWSVDCEILGGICKITIKETIREINQRWNNYTTYRHYPVTFEYDSLTNQWRRSSKWRQPKSEENEIKVSVSESIQDFFNQMLAAEAINQNNNCFIQIDGIPIGDNLLPFDKEEPFWNGIIDRLKTDHGIEVELNSFVDLCSPKIVPAYKNKALDGYFFHPQIRLSGDTLTINISCRRYDKDGTDVNVIALGHYQYKYSGDINEWKLEDSSFTLTLPKYVNF